MLTLFGPKTGQEDTTRSEMRDGHGRWNDYTRGAGRGGRVRRRRGAAAERDRDHACASRRRERMVTDGPFAETKEQLGGFYLIECEDLDEALEWAAKIPCAPAARSRSGR